MDAEKRFKFEEMLKEIIADEETRRAFGKSCILDRLIGAQVATIALAADPQEAMELLSVFDMYWDLARGLPGYHRVEETDLFALRGAAAAPAGICYDVRECRR